MENHTDRPTGFAATLNAVALLEDPRAALPLVGSALAEGGPVRRAALKFLLKWPGVDAGRMVLRAFAGLDRGDREMALAERPRLLTAAEAVLRDLDRAGRAGLAAFAEALPPSEGLPFLVQLIDDPIEAVRGASRGAFLRNAREYLAGRWTVTSPPDLRRLVTGVELAIRSAGEEEAAPLAAALFKASLESAKAQESLKALAAKGPRAAREAVLESLASTGSQPAASILLDLLSCGPDLNERVLAIFRKRRDPDFLTALAREASRRMESPAGIPASAVSTLAQVAWEALPAREVAALPVLAQRRLLAIARAFRGDLLTRARRIAMFLRSRDRHLREMTLDALADYPPATFKEELVPLLDDPTEELQLRAAELLARVGTAECRRKLIEKARRSSDRLRRFIAGRLAASGFPEAAAVRATAGAAAPRAPSPAGAFEEALFPVIRPILLARTRAGGR